MTSEERVEKRAIKTVRSNFRWAGLPPGGICFSVMKSHAAEETGIAKNESSPRLLQNEVIMPLGSEPNGLGPQLSSHPQMDPDPMTGGKTEKHLFTASGGAEEPASRQVFRDLPGIASAKNPLLGMELHRDDLPAEAGVPLPSKKFHLC